MRRARATSLAVCLALGLTTQRASSEDYPQVWLNPGFLSYHADREADFRENNIGFGVEAVFAPDHGFVAGNFINSQNFRSRYAMYEWRPLHWQPSGINISAGEPVRIWMEEKWIALLGSFSQYRFVVLSGPEDFEQKRRIETACSNVIPSPPTQNLYEVGLIVGALRLLVTPDTSLIHVASGAETPVVGLYREAPQDISRFGPFAIPCELVISSTGEVGSIEPDYVAAAMKKLLNATESC